MSERNELEWFRVGRSNPRNLYRVTDGEDWKTDQPIGCMYEAHIGELVAEALNRACNDHPDLLQALCPRPAVVEEGT